MVTRSRPTRARGLKLRPDRASGPAKDVAPHAGAWIETLRRVYGHRRQCVAPHAGAWIETLHSSPCLINSDTSRPTRARGLKPLATGMMLPMRGSRPTRARGLKHFLHLCSPLPYLSRPTRARGLKPLPARLGLCPKRVAPHAGAWIETPPFPRTAGKVSGRAPRGRVD